MLPNSLKTAMKTLPPFTKPLLLQALSDLRKPKVLNNDESLYSFVNRRFGPEVARYAIDPLARGVFAGNAKELSVMSLGRRLHDVEQKYGSVLKGLFLDRKNSAKVDPFLLKSKLVQLSKKEKWAVWSLDGGLKTLVDTLAKNNINTGCEIRKSSPVVNISSSSKNNSLFVHTDKETIECRNVISCIPANNLEKVVGELNSNVQKLLRGI